MCPNHFHLRFLTVVMWSSWVRWLVWFTFTLARWWCDMCKTCIKPCGSISFPQTLSSSFLVKIHNSFHLHTGVPISVENACLAFDLIEIFYLFRCSWGCWTDNLRYSGEHFLFLPLISNLFEVENSLVSHHSLSCKWWCMCCIWSLVLPFLYRPARCSLFQAFNHFCQFFLFSWLAWSSSVSGWSFCHWCWLTLYDLQCVSHDPLQEDIDVWGGLLSRCFVVK